MNREEKRALLLVLTAFGVLAVVIAAPMLAFVVACVLGCYGIYRAVRWALREDRKEADNRKVDQSLWEDLKDIEKTVMGSLPVVKNIRPKPKPKPGPDEPKVFDYEGRPMMCIYCGKYANKGGRFCDEHVE